MTDDLASANVNRSYQLAASSIAIFTFLLFFLYPKFISGDVDAWPFQITLMVMGVATFSFAFASLYDYGASLSGLIEDAARSQYSRLGDRFWLLGCVLLFLAPSGKTRLGRITRAGDELLRSTLVVGATSVIQQVRRTRRAETPRRGSSGCSSGKRPSLPRSRLPTRSRERRGS